MNYSETTEQRLFEAVKRNNAPIIRSLLDIGADVNTRDESGDTPLLMTCGSGHIDVIRLLLSRGADVNALNRDDIAPLHLVCRYGRHTDIVRLLIDHGADVNARDKGGFTPLQEACRFGHTDITRLLLEKGPTSMPETKSPILLPCTLHVHVVTSRQPDCCLMPEPTWRRRIETITRLFIGRVTADT